MEIYRTISGEAEATNIIEKSRFIAHVRPVQTREEADAFIEEIKGRYRDATHNVPAMVVGEKSQIQWASDDGEPQGTAGAPVVQMLIKEGITNIAVVVTRYFGGIKLGTGGLVRAYTSSVKLALEKAGLCGVMEMCSLEVEVEYTYLAKFRSMAGEVFDIAHLEYGEKVTMNMHIKTEDEDRIKRLINDVTSGRAVLKKTEKILVQKSLDIE